MIDYFFSERHFPILIQEFKNLLFNINRIPVSISEFLKSVKCFSTYTFLINYKFHYVYCITLRLKMSAEIWNFHNQSSIINPAPLISSTIVSCEME